jgi:hypothetical protein
MQLVRRSIFLGLLLPACVLAKSVGDDPESEGVQGNTATPESEDSSSTSDGSISASSSQSGTGQATPDYASCGVTIVPPEPGQAYWSDELTCEGGCVLELRSTVPTGFEGDPETGDCLCESIGCGGWTGDTHGSGYVSDGDSGAVNSCDFDPPPWDGAGHYSVSCGCETCDVRFDDISPEDADFFFDNGEELCDCLCEDAGCGEPFATHGEAGGSASTGLPGDDTTSGG